jgi:hypothetical protein
MTMTVKYIADQLTLAAIQNAKELARELRSGKKLRELGYRGQALSPGLEETLGFAIECILFAAFPIDVVLVNEWGNRCGAIREQFYRGLFAYIRDELAPAEHRQRFAQSEHSFTEFIAERFSEYADAMSTGQPHRLGRIAWTRICGSDAVSTGVFFFTTMYAAALKSFTGLATRIEIEQTG